MKPLYLFLLAIALTLLLLPVAIRARKGCFDCTTHQTIHFLLSGDTTKRPYSHEKLLPRR